MSGERIEESIRQQRTIEAVKNNLMGNNGKLGIILSAYGTSIIRQNTDSPNYSWSEPDDFVYTEYSPTLSGEGPVAWRDEILESENDSITEEGVVFDGLSRGMHLEIIYWEAENEIKVSFKGHLVYREIAGQLEAYYPSPLWESHIDRLYKSAKDKVLRIKRENDQIMNEQILRKKESFWNLMRKKWGF